MYCRLFLLDMVRSSVGVEVILMNVDSDEGWQFGSFKFGENCMQNIQVEDATPNLDIHVLRNSLICECKKVRPLNNGWFTVPAAVI